MDMKEKVSSMSKTFCPAPFVHFYHKGGPHGKVCCIAKSKLIHQKTAKGTWSSQRYKNIRQDMLDNKPVFDCEPCYNEEKLGGKSDRMYYLNKFIDNDYNIETGNELSKPIDLDLRLSNLCNLGCRMCIPSYSSIIEKTKQSIPELANVAGWDESSVANKMLTDEDIKWLINDNPNLRRVKFLGGEPTIMNEVYKILDLIIENKLQPLIGITTNCTNVNKRFIEYLKYFKNTTINMSIDGVGDTLEYIRHPVKFKTVDKNVDIICEHGTYVNVNFVIQALNIHNLSDFIDWITTKEKVQNINSVIVYSPKGVSPYYLPLEYRKPLLEKALNNKNIDNPIFKKTFIKQIEHLYKSNEEYFINEFVNLNLLYDQHRKQHLYKIMPDLKEILDNKILNIGNSSKFKSRLVEHFVEEDI